MEARFSGVRGLFEADGATLFIKSARCWPDHAVLFAVWVRSTAKYCVVQTCYLMFGLRLQPEALASGRAGGPRLPRSAKAPDSCPGQRSSLSPQTAALVWSVALRSCPSARTKPTCRHRLRPGLRRWLGDVLSAILLCGRASLASGFVNCLCNRPVPARTSSPGARGCVL